MPIRSVTTLKPGERTGKEPSAIIPMRFDKSAPESMSSSESNSDYQYPSGRKLSELMKAIRTDQDVSDALM